MKENSYIIFSLGINVIQVFSLTLGQNKLGCMSLVRFSGKLRQSLLEWNTLLSTSLWVGSCPYPQTADKTEKGERWQTLNLIRPACG
jgi:hypothetical protein